MSLPSVTFDCEILTPTFLAGARQDGAPELRGPSLRGALRYWYRALLGGRGVTDLDTLREEEAKVFGSPERASPVRVRLLPYQITDGDKKPNDEIVDDQNSGAGYLWYFVQAGSNDRQYIAPGARFELQMLARPGQEQALEEAIGALWVLAHLGGLGLRSRRLAGSFAANLVDAPEALDLPAFEPSGDYDEWVGTQFRGLGVGTAEAGASEWSSLHSSEADVWRLSGVEEENWEDLVEYVGRKFKEFREMDDLDVPDKVGLGLPIVTPSPAGAIEVTQNGTDVDRRASPLWLQVISTSNGTLTPVITLLRSQFAEDGNRVHVSWDGGRETVSQPYRKIRQFVTRDASFKPVSLL